MAFFGSNVRQLRRVQKLSQTELAERVHASVSTISEVEAGHEPAEMLKAAIGVALGVHPEFFDAPLLDSFTVDDCNFRKGGRAEAEARQRVVSQGSLFAHIMRGIVARYDVRLAPTNLPINTTAVTQEEIEDVADACRRLWGLGADRPIVSMNRVLEQKAGVLLTRLTKPDGEKLQAFSRRGYDGRLSFVVLNPATGSTSQARFDMAHELGHLICHPTPLMHGLELKDRERAADRFASAFLMPRAGFRRAHWAGGRVNWTALLELKTRWKTSLEALLYRAFSLGYIDAIEHRRAYKYLSAKKWLHNEPNEPPPELPETFRNTMAVLRRRKGLDASAIAKELHMTLSTFERITAFRDEPTQDEQVVSLQDHLRLRSGNGGSRPRAG